VLSTEGFKVGRCIALCNELTSYFASAWEIDSRNNVDALDCV